MSRLTTRIVAQVGPSDDLRCSICGEWKRANSNFRIQQGASYLANAHKPSYFGWCHDCESTRSAMGTRVDGNKRRLPTVNEVRAYLAAGGNAYTPQTAKKSPNTKGVSRDPIDDHEVEAALGVLRDARAQRRKEAQGYVYCISDGYAVKIGYSVKPQARVNELQTGSSRVLRLLASLEGTEEDEATLHSWFMDDNIHLEWFKPSELLLSMFGLSMEVFKHDAEAYGP